jgi:hypothetical protein
MSRGGQVEIVKQDNEVLGIGNANRGVIWHSEQDAKYQGFHLTLG